MDPLLVSQGHHQQRTDSELPVGLMANPGVGEGVVASLKLARPHTDTRKAVAQLEPGGFRAHVNQWHQILTLDRFDHGAAGAGQPLASLGDDPHDGL
jgi:hypothetical protein